VESIIHWDDFHEILAPYYCRDLGRTPILPVTMLKLEFLRYHHHLSDRGVIARAQTDVAFLWFLQYPLGGGNSRILVPCAFSVDVGESPVFAESSIRWLGWLESTAW
jgi:hypothetical protein